MNIFNPFRFSIESLGLGYLYNHYSVTNANFATTGWSVPTISNWDTLMNYLINNGYGYEGSGSDITKSMASTVLWDTWATLGTPGNDQVSNNSSGFNGKPCGFRGGSGASGIFTDLYGSAHWWTFDGTSTISRKRYFTKATATLQGTSGFYNSEEGLSVRLVKDSTTLNPGETSTMIDYDGNIYDTICIGTQEWMSQNWKCTRLNNGTYLTKGGVNPNFFTNTEWEVLTTEGYCAYDNNESNV